tara:strand:+ start:1643 stop:2077 length:435 start_codon:yes stop_codon:yes gene_type:complete
MPYTFNDEKFPVVTVVRSEYADNDDEVYQFRDYWKKQYERKQNFSFILVLDKVKDFQLKSAYLTAKIIGEMKKEPEHYLKKTIIIFKDQLLINIITLMCTIQKPISQLFLLNSNKNNIDKCVRAILSNEMPDEEISVVNSCFQK